jgi:hypothetical protein
MTPTDFAAKELAMWQEALGEQRIAEQELERISWAWVNDRALEKLSEVEDLRTRADLLLAGAVKVKYKYREQGFKTRFGREANRRSRP